MPLDDRRVLITAVDCPKDGEEAVTHAYIYEPTLRPDPFRKLPALPIALQGATTVAVGGNAYVLGGRAVVKDEDGAWNVPVDGSPRDINGKTTESGVWCLDATSEQWQSLPLQFDRVGATAVVVAGKVWLLGGEETFTAGEISLPVSLSRATGQVSIFAPDTGLLTAGPSLLAPVAFANAMVDDAGRIVIGGGFDIVAHGNVYEPMSSRYRLDPERDEPEWRAVQPFPGTSTSTYTASIALSRGIVFSPLATGQGNAAMLERP